MSKAKFGSLLSYTSYCNSNPGQGAQFQHTDSQHKKAALASPVAPIAM